MTEGNSWALFSLFRRSLMLRVLLPIGAMLVVIVVGAVIGVAWKDTLSAHDQLAADPDYVGSALTDDKGKVLASDGSTTAKSGALITQKIAVEREEAGVKKTIGWLELRMSTARSDAEIAHGTWVLGLVGLGALVVVCGLLFLILKSATSIAGAVEQQSAATREISSSVSHAASGTQIVASVRGAK